MPDTEASLLEQSLLAHNETHAHSSNDKKQSAKEDAQIVDLTKMSVKAAERCHAFQSLYGNEALKILMELSERHEMLNPLKHPKEPYVRCWEEKWMPTGKNCRDFEGEEMVQKLAEFLKNKQTLFEDPIFAADNESLFADPADAASRSNARQTDRKDQDEFLAGVKGIEWKRPNEWGDPSDKVVIWDTKGGIDPDDVQQGKLGNCYYLAAIASCAQGDDDVLLKDLCIEDYGYLGLYAVKFFMHGKWMTVLIDDRIPCVKADGKTWMPIFSSPGKHSGQSKGTKELWPMMFEKAWAKLHLSYEATSAGLTGDACSYLTGGVLRAIDLEDGDKEINELAWVAILKALIPEKESGLTSFCSCSVRDEVNADEVGLLKGHAYSILKAVECSNGSGNKIRLVQVRNPWGSHEWKGDYSDTSSLWTDALKKEAGWEDEVDGSFFIKWEDFTLFFEDIDVCDPTILNTFSEGHQSRYDIFASYWVAMKTAGGSPPEEGSVDGSLFEFNPKAKLTVTEDCTAAITLFLPDTRWMQSQYQSKYSLNIRDVAMHMASVYITDTTEPSASPKKILTTLPEDRQATNAEVQLKKGHEYHITAATFAPGQQGAFTIGVAGYGAQMEPMSFKYKSVKDSSIFEHMASNNDPHGARGCCSNCHHELTKTERIYLTPRGPMCKDCKEGKNRDKKVRKPLPGSDEYEFGRNTREDISFLEDVFSAADHWIVDLAKRLGIVTEDGKVDKGVTMQLFGILVSI